MKWCWRLVSLGLLLTVAAPGQPKRVLYVTHSAGYRHDSIGVSIDALRQVAAASGLLEIVATEDTAMLNAAALRNFDAVLFFTSGELPVSDSQKQDLLEFVRGGKGFGGVHSATDTFYTWPAYGDLIGARFNGHPWVQEVRLDVEDPRHPAVAHWTPGFKILDEIYQFREFSRDRVRVLLTLDAQSVNLASPGANADTEDFPLAWCRSFGEGRVFYTALGHFDTTWRDPGFLRMMGESLLWLTGQVEGDATPRPVRRPVFTPDGIGNSASLQPRMAISPGSLLTIFGENLTAGGVAASDARLPLFKLAGTTLKLNGVPAPMIYASPSQVNAYVPLEQRAGSPIELRLSAGGGGPDGTAATRLATAAATPGIFTLSGTREWVTLWATGLGPVEPVGGMQVTVTQPVAAVNGRPARVLFSGLAPGWVGLYQVNVEIPRGTAFPANLTFEFNGFRHSAVLHPPP